MLNCDVEVFYSVEEAWGKSKLVSKCTLSLGPKLCLGHDRKQCSNMVRLVCGVDSCLRNDLVVSVNLYPSKVEDSTCRTDSWNGHLHDVVLDVGVE